MLVPHGNLRVVVLVDVLRHFPQFQEVLVDEVVLWMLLNVHRGVRLGIDVDAIGLKVDDQVHDECQKHDKAGHTWKGSVGHEFVRRTAASLPKKYPLNESEL